MTKVILSLVPALALLCGALAGLGDATGLIDLPKAELPKIKEALKES